MLPGHQAADTWSSLIVEAAPNALLMVDSARNVVLVNRETEALFGYSREEILGKPVERLLADRYRGKHVAEFASFHADVRPRGTAVGVELCGLRKDASEFPIEMRLTPIVVEHGRYTLAAVIDLSERKRNEAEHEKLAALVEAADDAIVSKTFDGIIQTWNGGATRLLGYTRAEAVGRHVKLIVPEQLLDEEAALMASVRNGEPILHYETMRKRRDGMVVDVSVTLSPIVDTFGKAVGVLSISHDISELKRRGEELARSNAELEQFAYVASHDLQEPLRMVANYTELLAERYRGKLDERADKYIHYASDGARRMQRLVADLLIYSRVGSQGKPFLPVPTREVLDSVTESLQLLIRETQAAVTHDTLPVVLADEVQLRQLFQNLIGNAIKFRGREDPRVHVKAAQHGALWQFSVSDNGIGMDMQYAERIFQMFQRLHELGKYEGSGIGLAVAKRIVERHGGRIWVESRLGEGTTFHFTLQATKGDK